MRVFGAKLVDTLAKSTHISRARDRGDGDVTGTAVELTRRVSRALSPSRRARVCVLSPVSRACRGVSRGFPGRTARRECGERDHTQHTQRARRPAGAATCVVSDTPQGAAV